MRLATKTLLPRAIQQRMQLGAPESRPLGDINDAMKELDLSDEEIISLIGSTTKYGALIGFNIATGEDGRSEIRILTKSLEHFKATNGQTRLNLSWAEIFDLIFPRRKAVGANHWLTGLQIKRGLNCTRPHVASLARYFTVINESKPGRGNTPSFTTASVEHWLKGRLL